MIPRLLILSVLVLVGVGIHAVFFIQTQESNLRVTFFDVGQGDSIFIESPTGKQLLIDGGVGSGVLKHLSKEMGFFDRHIDFVLATHPDKDHIGGLPDVFERYQVGTIITTENTGETATAKEVRRRMMEETDSVFYARRGMQFDLGGGVFLDILFPDRDPALLESNTASVIAQLTYGETEFLFTGDAPKSVEDYLVVLSGEGKKLTSDVLKIGHHGSRTSTSELFLISVAPEFGVISAALGNRYGHPHQEVVDLLEKHNVETKNTASLGSIFFESNGVDVFVR